MSYANGTPFLNLPQTVGTDKRDWFDTNEAFLDLDAKVKAAYEGEIDTAAALAALSETVSGLSTTVSGLNTTVGQHTTSIATINEALTLINTALTGLDTSVNTKFDSAGIADVYDADHGTYSVNDVVTYNGQRYVCHTAVTAAEPFDADKWTAEDVQTVLENISGDISHINTALTSIEPRVLKSVTTDGVKTWKDMLNEFYSSITPLNSNQIARLKLRASRRIFNIFLEDSNNHLYRFGKFEIDSNDVSMNQIEIKESYSSYFKCHITGTPTVTITDISANIPTSGEVWELLLY